MKEEKQIEITKVVNGILKIRTEKNNEVSDYLFLILGKSKEVFETISYFQNEFLKDKLRPIDFYYNTQDRLTGCYMYLSPIVNVLESLVKNRSLNFYHCSKIEIEKSEAKFVSAPVEKESDNYVATERYVYSAFAGYLDACKGGIQTCRSRIKEQNEQLDLSK